MDKKYLSAHGLGIVANIAFVAGYIHVASQINDLCQGEAASTHSCRVWNAPVSTTFGGAALADVKDEQSRYDQLTRELEVELENFYKGFCSRRSGERGRCSIG